MKKQKIDSLLMIKSMALSSEQKICCIVRAYDFFKVKKFLISKKYEILNEYLFIKSFFLKLTKSQIETLSDNLHVDYIHSNISASALTYLSKKILNTDNSNLSGVGVNVAVIDTGISPHLDFMLGEKRIKKWVDFVGNKKYPYDDNGHGSFVSGVLAGSGAESVFKFSGVAPRSNIFALKALDKNGESGSDTILNAMEWIYDNHVRDNIKVVCMSFGSEPLGIKDPIMAGAEALWDDGVIVVSAAGNSGPEFQTIRSPGVSPKIITVGGLNDNRIDELSFNSDYFEVADFSSRGPAFNRIKPDVIAPAVDIKSCSKNGGYTMLSGTSVATPMVAGMMCLLCEKHKDMNPERAKRILLRACKPITFNRNLEGFGIPNFEKMIF